MSTTTSASTGMLASGSTVTVSVVTGVTHARPSRPFTRTPHVPHEAWKQLWRITSERSACTSIQRRPSSTVEASPAGTSNSST